MSNPLGKRSTKGTLGPDNPYSTGSWVVTFDPAVLAVKVPFEVYHIAVQGPANSTFQVYQGTAFYDGAQHGDINSWDPAQPMLCEPGDTIFFYYDVTATPAPLITLYLRENVRENSPYLAR